MAVAAEVEDKLRRSKLQGKSQDLASDSCSPKITHSLNKQPSRQIDVFETSIGWFGVQHHESTIQRIRFGFASRNQVLSAFSEDACQLEISTERNCWRETIELYAAGESVSFSDLQLETEWMTPFQKNVIASCRQIPPGKTLTYGQLADAVGSPGAARAVGSVMRTNRFPIVVPCHRVVGAKGLGGFSASRGVKTKRMLLELENATQPDPAARRLFD